MAKDPRDSVNRRCPKLGGPVDFGYCRTSGEDDLPCFKIFDCWWEVFDIVGFMQDTLSPDQFEHLMAQKPPNKLGSLVELVQRIQKHQNDAQD